MNLTMNILYLALVVKYVRGSGSETNFYFFNINAVVYFHKEWNFLFN